MQTSVSSNTGIRQDARKALAQDVGQAKLRDSFGCRVQGRRDVGTSELLLK